MKIDPSDVKLLHVFIAVVESNGVANAQAMLNKDASTISKALTQLEDRLQLRLCERGRQGFSITSEGAEIYNEALKLFVSIRGLEQKIGTLNGSGAGCLDIGIIDNIIGDENCPLGRALQSFQKMFSPKHQFNVHVDTPSNLERYLLSKKIDVAISIFEGKHDDIVYVPLYREMDKLYCATTSPLGQKIASGAQEPEVLAMLSHQSFVSRKFLSQRDLGWLCLNPEDQVCYTSNIEAVLFLIASGQSVGFMPEHYARTWVANGSLTAVLPEKISHRADIDVAYLRTSSVLRPGLTALLDSLGTNPA